MSSRISGVTLEVDPARLDQPVLAFLKDYWEKKRGAHAMPSRADIKPSEMKEYLGWIMLVDVLPGADDFRYRMIGSRVTEYFLTDSTGRTIREAFTPYGEAAVNAVLLIYRKAAQARVPVRAHGGAAWLGQSFLDFDALCMPLSDDGVTVNMIFGGFTFGMADTLKKSPPDPKA
jgi:hypothetical protein